jgi:hypothetical protein
VFCNHLVLAFGFVDAKSSTYDDVSSIFWSKGKAFYRSAEHYASDLSVTVFEGEVEMTCWLPMPTVRQFSFDPNEGIV